MLKAMENAAAERKRKAEEAEQERIRLEQEAERERLRREHEERMTNKCFYKEYELHSSFPLNYRNALHVYYAAKYASHSLLQIRRSACRK
jgi:hypothetical protein